MDSLEVKIFKEIGNADGWFDAPWFSLSELTDQLKGFSGSEIRVIINSFGGQVLEGLSIYNVLRGRSETVDTQVVGYAASMGSVLLMAGQQRSMPENSYMHIHGVQGAEWGNVTDMEQYTEWMRSMNDMLKGIYVSASGQSAETVSEFMAGETWLPATRALELGFVTTLTDGVYFEANAKAQSFVNQYGAPADLFQPKNKTVMALPDNVVNAISTVTNFLSGQASAAPATENAPADGPDETGENAETPETPDSGTETPGNVDVNTGQEATDEEASVEQPDLNAIAESINAAAASMQETATQLRADTEALRTDLSTTNERIEAIEQRLNGQDQATANAKAGKTGIKPSAKGAVTETEKDLAKAVKGKSRKVIYGTQE